MSVDDFRGYILGFIFFKYLSEKMEIYSDEIPCIEARPYATQREGTVYLFLAMDARSGYAIHMDARPDNSVGDYIAFIDSLKPKLDFYTGLGLAMDLPVIQRRPIMEAFKMDQEVLCDRDTVYRITEEFHVGFAAQSGIRALN